MNTHILPYAFIQFWNLIVFVQPNVVKAKRSQGGELSWCQAFAVAFGFTITARPAATDNTAGDAREMEGGREGKDGVIDPWSNHFEDHNEREEDAVDWDNNVDLNSDRPAAPHGNEEEKIDIEVNKQGSNDIAKQACTADARASRTSMKQRLSQVAILALDDVDFEEEESDI